MPKQTCLESWRESGCTSCVNGNGIAGDKWSLHILVPLSFADFERCEHATSQEAWKDVLLHPGRREAALLTAVLSTVPAVATWEGKKTKESTPVPGSCSPQCRCMELPSTWHHRAGKHTPAIMPRSPARVSNFPQDRLFPFYMNPNKALNQSLDFNFKKILGSLVARTTSHTHSTALSF